MVRPPRPGLIATPTTITRASGGLALAVLAIAFGPVVSAHTDPAVGVAAIGLAWLGFGVGAAGVLRLPVRLAVTLIVTGGVAMLLVASTGPPRSSDDLYRYLWDGRVQAAGIDPYRDPPAATGLVGLRDPALWPATGPWCVSASTVDSSAVPLAPGCTLINRPSVPTIYPPVAEALFAAVHGLSPPGSGYAPLRVLGILAALGTTGLLLWGLQGTGGDPRRAVLWAWCPTVALEAVNNAHVDAVAALLTGAALVTLARARHRSGAALGGVLLGLAVATKLTPALAIPAALRRRPVSVLLAATGAVISVYLPHLVAVGARAVGYLPGYLQEEGYGNGHRFALLSLVVPDTWAAPLAALVLAAAALWAWRSADPDRPWRAATTVAGVALLVTTPAYPWYALVLVLLVALGGRWSWLTVAAAAYVGQYQRELRMDTVLAERIGYGVALAVVLVTWCRYAGVPRRVTTPWDTPVGLARPADTVER